MILAHLPILVMSLIEYLTLGIIGMRKAFFVWQHSSKGYSPAIYYDEVPKSIEKGLGPKIAAAHKIDSQFMSGPDGEVDLSFSRLAIVYPAPIDPVEPKVKLDV
jgi:hypothetical protein